GSYPVKQTPDTRAKADHGLSSVHLGEGKQGREQSSCGLEPDSGKPTVRDPREALGNTAKEELVHASIKFSQV
ncbi:MAG: hypothetical protein L0Y56_01265, partial [Nitrospira sp.]|nr:hypothetical protein [Nitrospira sp.]